MSMYTAVSGLKSQQSKLDVIGNNIANISTVGYKAQTVSFSDLLSQTISAATAASNTVGGKNAQQVGLGVNISSIATDMSEGSTESTGNSHDLAINGNGFFITAGSGTGSYHFTRQGNFGVDDSGNLVVDGQKICGWEEYTTTNGTATYNTQKTVEPINLFSDSYNGNKKVIPPEATSTATLTGNLDPSTTAPTDSTDLTTMGTVPSTADGTTTLTVYDAQGNKYDVTVNLYKCKTDTTDASNPITSYYWTVASSDTTTLGVSGSGYIAFDSSGKAVTTATGTNSGGTSTTYTFDDKPSITLTPTGSNAGSSPFTVSMDLSGVSTYTSSSGYSVSGTTDGYASGDLSDYSIGSDGVITGTYSNGQQQTLGMIALANFTNPAGLEKVGGNLYDVTSNSGDFTGGVAAGSSGTGSIASGELEMSNVDLSGQFSEMMITERAYQANSKVITTTDTMMQTVIDLIR
ncbi:MAG: flagellar hook protein FlgE [Negativicutes bacterium]|nr:flagellar hook protein FlgE [Negativicutes bacterium]